MEQGDPPSAEEAANLINRCEDQLVDCGSISATGQKELRALLRADLSAGLRSRVVRLLNPRGAPVVHLTEADFTSLYVPTTADNYARPLGEWDQLATFDEAHGFYVTIDVRPLRRSKRD